MAKEINVTIENKLVMEKRDMNVYHHSTRSAHMISHNNSITLPLRTSVEDDYLHISVVSGPGHLENKSLVNLPSWADFELSSQGNIIVAHSGDRTLLKIPPGPSTWQLKMTRSITSFINQAADRVTIGDDRLEYS
jgi:hypothetical protein